MSDPYGATYYGDGSRYSASQQRAMEREAEEQEEITARAVAWLEECVREGYDFEDGSIQCLCGRNVAQVTFASHAETCRALRREVE